MDTVTVEERLKYAAETRTPQLACRQMELRGTESWAEIAAAFSSADAIEYRQAWLDRPAPDFAGATVRTGWNAQALLVYAVLEDRQIFNPATEFNELAFTMGDVFEIFLRPEHQKAYFEFHISPRNQIFQLRIPSTEAFHNLRPGEHIPAGWFIYDWKINSRVMLEPEIDRWQVFAAIPFNRTVEERAPTIEPGIAWLFSFSRYDYPGANAEPVLSSTSPHKEVNFHRQSEWGRLLFKPHEK